MKKIIKADFGTTKPARQVVTIPQMVKYVTAEAIRYSRPFPEDDGQRKGFMQGVEWGMSKILCRIQYEQEDRTQKV
tara:strand:+ start:1238 stop:1465 length:228 start_codon:yes stop_codon:yes gene_type:complete